MRIGTSIFLIAVGAILAYAVNRKQVAGVEIDTAGQILLIIGIIGLIISLLYEFMYARNRQSVVTRYDEPPVVREREVPARERDRFRDRY